MEKIDIKSLRLDELQDYIVSRGGKKFNGTRIYRWLHQKNVNSFDEMTDISKTMRETLKQECVITTVSVRKKQVSKDGTIKYLYQFEDGNCIETVLMRYEHGNSICVSCQVGCRMGCTFCASTQHGKVRDLTVSEILEQVYNTERDIGERISNIVMMGIGEPLDNYDTSVKFIRMISSEDGKNISQRNISLSTCGIVPRIYDLANEKLGVTLSISLHATTTEKRKVTMPITNAYSVEELLKACRDYTRITGRRISFEYSMIKGVNDTDDDARRLSELLKGMISHVNLIPINPVDGSPYTQSDDRVIHAFQKKLLALGVNATIRRRLGQDISAACGQLRNENR
ncbi:MAG: 23S rRNA (adenine(2503)-C(2))-methyltransferase RlmN [Oscillospiraceae bacterium]|nr:23S rRNA (adenine(2503)-C(2))-methyltransferase RlmN [Oscillospiraceae bacterium]